MVVPSSSVMASGEGGRGGGGGGGPGEGCLLHPSASPTAKRPEYKLRKLQVKSTEPWAGVCPSSLVTWTQGHWKLATARAA